MDETRAELEEGNELCQDQFEARQQACGLLGEAEDLAEALSVTGSATVPAASCDGNCLVTRDFTPLEPGVSENKYYAPDKGLILEVDLETGERLELVEIIRP